MSEIRVLYVDDHEMVRQSIAERLQRCDGIAVVGQADRGETAITTADDVKPDVVVMDAVLPGLESFEAFRRIKEAQPLVAGLFISAFIYDRYIDEALKSGAKGFISKSPDMDVLIDSGPSNDRGTTARGSFPGCNYGRDVLVEFFELSSGSRILLSDGSDSVRIEISVEGGGATPIRQLMLVAGGSLLLGVLLYFIIRPSKKETVGRIS